MYTINSKTSMKKLKMIPCVKCLEPMPELRKTQYGYNFCVNCSTVESKVAKTMVYGTGDHTWNDIQIMDRSTARKLAEVEARALGQKFDASAFDQDLIGTGESRSDQIRRALDPDEYVQDNSPAKEEKSILDDLIKEKPSDG